MPLYEYHCETCKKDVTVAMSMSEHDRGGAACPSCGGRTLQPLIGSFYTKTSRKS